MSAAADARTIDRELRRLGNAERAERERAYLKHGIEHYGVRVPEVRSVVKRVIADSEPFDHDAVVALAEQLWRTGVHETRLAAVESLVVGRDRLEPGDVGFVELLLRESGTWALVDPMAISVMGDRVERYPELCDALDRWATDDDFWIRRAALLTLLVPLRRGGGDFDRFARYADTMLDDREFFIRKAIGWVLRDTAKARPDLAKARPDLVYEWLRPRAASASGVTVREAVKPLTAEQRSQILAAR